MTDHDAPTIDPLAPDLRVLGDLLNRLPHRPSPPVVCRWILKGVRGTKLRTIKIAGRHMTTEREFRRFVEAMQLRPAEWTSSDLDAVDRQLAESGYA